MDSRLQFSSRISRAPHPDEFYLSIANPPTKTKSTPLESKKCDLPLRIAAETSKTRQILAEGRGMERRTSRSKRERRRDLGHRGFEELYSDEYFW